MRPGILTCLSAALLVLAGTSRAQDKTFEPALPMRALSPNCAFGATHLCVPIDASFTTVVFDGIGGNGPANPLDLCQRNDDDVTLAIPLPFAFNLFGTTYMNVFINNNGNISFGSSFSTYTSTGFPVSGFPMVAPFWADVDTRNASSGVVHYRIDAHKLVVAWDHVGYFNSHADKLNTFELMISDGTDLTVGLGNNVCFCYDDMQWTTGDASVGIGGFGGVPATVGVNRGDGTTFIQFGRFDHPGVDSDGPGGASDGVDFLDGRTLCFNVTGSNVPPVPLGFPIGGAVNLCPGDSLVLATGFASPELGQTTTTVVTTNLPPTRYTLTNTSGNPSSQLLKFFSNLSDVNQIYSVTYTATDNGVPVASSTVTLTINLAGTNCPTPARKATWGAVKAHYR